MLWVARKSLRVVCVLLCVVRPPVRGQPSSAMTSFRHAKTTKEIASLDWISMFEPLAPYSEWWKETAACAHIPREFIRADSVQFYFVNASDFAPLPTDKPNRLVMGVTYAWQQQIFLSVLKVRDERVVKHEMLHQLLFWYNESHWDNESLDEFRKCRLEMTG